MGHQELLSQRPPKLHTSAVFAFCGSIHTWNQSKKPFRLIQFGSCVGLLVQNPQFLWLSASVSAWLYHYFHLKNMLYQYSQTDRNTTNGRETMQNILAISMMVIFIFGCQQNDLTSEKIKKGLA